MISLRRDEFVGKGRQRHQLTAITLRQLLEQLQHLVAKQTGHQPFAGLGRQAVQIRQRERQRNAVVRCTRREVIRQIKSGATNFDLRRKVIRRHAAGLMAHQIIPIQIQQLWIRLFSVTPPGVETGAIDNVGRNPCIVKGFDQRIIDQHILAALLMFKLFNLFDEFLVMSVERPATHPGRINLAAHEAFADKNLTRCGSIQWAVMHTPLGLQR